MPIATGETVYTLGTPPCCGTGLRWTNDDLDAAIAGPVTAIIFDDVGKAEVATLLSSLAETEFEQTRIAKILALPEAIEDWRVGEGLAEAYLTNHHACMFPWPDSRDERKSGSSLPGADLVGFQTDSAGDRFAFGEVKTSSEEKYPPGAMHGRTGLKQQLEDLRDQEPIRNKLVEYLAYRAMSAPWRSRYAAAASRYVKNSADVGVFGVMVRDVEPHEDDLRARVGRLAPKRPADMDIALLALYLPKGSIAQLGTKARAAKAGTTS